MTTKLRVLALLLTLPAGAGAAVAPAESPTGSFGDSVDVNVVNVDVVVTDRNGHRVTGLGKEDFEVLENGKPVAISNFEAVERPVTRPLPAVSSQPATVTAERPVPEVSETPRVETPDDALNLVVLLDNAHLRPENRTRAVEQIRKFLAQNARPSDRVMLATHGLGLQVAQPFTSDPGLLDQALRSIETTAAPGGSQLDQNRRAALHHMNAIRKIDPCSYAMLVPIETYAQETRGVVLQTLDALKFLVNSLAGVPGRKALLYVSDGLPLTPGEELYQVVFEYCGCCPSPELRATEPPEGPVSTSKVDKSGDTAPYPADQALLDAQKYSLARRFADLTAHANANRVTFYTLQATGLIGLSASNAALGPDERALQVSGVRQVLNTNLQNSLFVMASDTGGRAILDTNELLPELQEMQEDSSLYYSLGYTPAHVGDGKEHRLEVKVKKAGLRARYRQGYRDKPLAERVVDRTLAALVHGIEDNPLEIAMEVGEPTLSDKGVYTVPVRLRIPLFRLTVLNRDQTFQGKLRLVVVTGDDRGGTSTPRQVPVPIEIPRKQVLGAMGQYYLYTLSLNMPAGSQRVAVAVRDELGAATSYLSRKVEVGGSVIPSSK